MRNIKVKFKEMIYKDVPENMSAKEFVEIVKIRTGVDVDEIEEVSQQYVDDQDAWENMLKLKKE